MTVNDFFWKKIIIGGLISFESNGLHGILPFVRNVISSYYVFCIFQLIQALVPAILGSTVGSQELQQCASFYSWLFPGLQEMNSNVQTHTVEVYTSNADM